MKSTSYVKCKHHGIVTDLPAEEVAPENWTGGSNIQFQDLATRRVGGYEPYAAPLNAAPIFAIQITIAGVANWIYCTTDHVFVTDGALHTDITPAAGLLPVTPGMWTACILNGIPVLNNSLNAPFYWPLTGLCLYLPGWETGAVCKVIRAFKYHLFALNITSAGGDFITSLWWSESAEPGTIPASWAPTPENDAGDMTLSDTAGGIVDGLAMRDTFMVYKEFSTYSINYVAGQYVYTQRKNFLTSGALTSNCIAEINGNHWVFTGTDVIQHDGQSFNSVVQMKVKRELAGSVDPKYLDQCCIAVRKSQNQIWVCIPEQDKGYLSKAYVINTDTLEVGIRLLPNVAYVALGVIQAPGANMAWDDDDASWESDATFWNQQYYSSQNDSLLMCDTAGQQLLSVDTTETNDGQPVYAYAERLSLPINQQDSISRKLVSRLVPRIEGNLGDTIYIRVGVQAYFGTPITWTEPLPFVIGTDVAVSFLADGRLISVRFEASTVKSWKIHSYTLAFVDMGLF